MGNTIEEPIQYTKTGRVRKRKPKVKNMYFTQETEDSIIKYLKTKDDIKRNILFNTKINPALFKLSENIIHTFKFYYLDVDSIEELKHECVSLLITKLKGYDKSLGKAYSYFGTILKRHLIVYNQKNFKRLKDRGDMKEVESNKNISNELINDHINSDPVDVNYIINKFIGDVESNINKYFPKEKDQVVVQAILHIFKRRENLDILNKKSLYIYIREITDITTPNITTIIKKLKSIYKDNLNKHLDY